MVLFYIARNGRRNSILFINLFILIAAFIMGSASSIFAQPTSFKFNHLTTIDGLSQSSVNWIHQDKQGYMWFATSDGLNKFDGYEFTIYKYNSKDSTSISDNLIETIYEDSQGNLWIGTRGGGLNLFNRDHDNFTRYLHDPKNNNSISCNEVFSILEDEKENLWISTSSGLNYFNRSKNVFKRFAHDPGNSNSLSNNYVLQLFRGSDGRIWLGCRGALNLFDSKRKSFKHFLPDEYVEGSTISGIAEDEKGNLWVAYDGSGLFYFDVDNEQFTRVGHTRIKNTISHNGITSIAQINGNLWIGTHQGGLNILNLKTRTFNNYKNQPNNTNSISSNTIHSIFEDRQGNVWIGTWSTGLNVLFNEKKFLHYKCTSSGGNTLNNSIVKSIMEDEEGKFWIGTEGGGLNYFDRDKNSFINYMSHPSWESTDYILGMFKTKNGNLWIGSYRGGLNYYNKKNKSFTNFRSDKNNPESLSNDDVSVMLEDYEQNLWVGTWGGGLNLLNKGTDRFIHFKHKPNKPASLSRNLVNALFEDSKRNLWVGTDAGLNLLNKDRKTFKVFLNNEQDPLSLSNNSILVFHEDKKGRLWIGTGGGLNLYHPEKEKFTSYTEKDGLPNNVIVSILEDDHGNLWLGTNKGISKFDPKERSFRNYTVGDGLQGNEFKRQAAFKSKSGEMYFGGVNGFNIFHPDSIKDNNYSPPVVFTDFQIFNKSIHPNAPDSPLQEHISVTKEIVLPYHLSVISFEYAALNYLLPEQNQYAYMLEGFDKEWNYVGNARTATYTNLDPGKYLLKIKASNNDGVWNEEGTTLSIIITPPFWKTTQAYILYGVLLSLLMYGALKYYSERIKLQNSLLFEKKQRQLEHDLNEERLRFFTGFSHELKTPLTLILAPVEDLINKNGKDKHSLNLIHKNARYLLQIINKLLEFRKTEVDLNELKIAAYKLNSILETWINNYQHLAQKRKVDLIYHATKQDIIAYIDLEKLQIMVNNLLSNAFKFTPVQGRIEVILNQDKSNILIQVKDTGIGIHPDAVPRIFNWYYSEGGSKNVGTGIGLALTKRLAELHQGDVLVESTLNQGTTFTITIPHDQKLSPNPQKHTVPNVSDYFFDVEVPNLPDFEYLIEKEECEEKIIHTNSETTKEVLLLVDDNPGIIQYLTGLLKDDYNILNAFDGQQGLEKAFKYIPDLIISDISMPKKSGIEFCQSLKHHVATSHIPVILLTVNNTFEYIKNGFTEGADLYVTKPFNGQLLLTQVKSLLEKRKQLKDYFNSNTSEAEDDNEEENTTLFHLEKKFLDELESTILSHIESEETDVESIAQALGMSRTSLFRKIKAITGQNINEFIRAVKIKKASELISESGYNISQAAYAVGFSSIKHFRKHFKDQYGKLPSELNTKKSYKTV
ncbi:two-component regulator propeller domain-containing protein [Pontibacter sp. 13R65]